MGYKSNIELQRVVTEIFAGKRSIDYNVWSKIISGLFQESEVEALNMLLKNKSYQSRMKKTA